MSKWKQNSLAGALLFLALQMSGACWAAADKTRKADSAEDWRNIATGYTIPREGYCDQPYVVITKDGNWLCVLTTGQGREGTGGQHVISTISKDRGKTWSKPIDIEPSTGPDASWAVPLVTPSGRVYAFYDYNGDEVQGPPGGRFHQASTGKRVDMLGWYVYKFSDDNGKSWSAQRQRLPMRLTACDRGNDWQGKVIIFWGICKPQIADSDVYFAFSKLGRYMLEDGEGWLYRSDNLLTESDPGKLHWEMLPEGDHGIRAAEFGSVQEEHNLVWLGGQRLFCVYRTSLGRPCQSSSDDGGRHWTKPIFMTYTPGGQTFKTPRACPKLWRTAEGKYLFWFHNNGVEGFKQSFKPKKTDKSAGKVTSPKTDSTSPRNIAWLSGGVLKDGAIHWSQPEVVLYEENRKLGPSYPDLIEQDGKFWLTETQKTEARVHPLDRGLLEGMWNQAQNKKVASAGLVLSLAGDALQAKQAAMPVLPPLAGHGLTLDFRLKLDDLSPGQILLDWRNAAGKGGVVRTTPQRTIQIELDDGKHKAAWDCDAGLLKVGRPQHVTIIVDGGPRLITFLVDGKVCDGGTGRLFGWGRFSDALDDVKGGKLQLAPQLNGRLLQLRVYDRYLRNSEAVGNYRADIR